MSDYCITLDGGTTNTRATLVHGTELIDTVSTQVGVRDSRPNQPSPVFAAVAQCLHTLKDRHSLDPEVVPAVASGMIGSDAGLVNVPHLMAPTSAEDAAGGMHAFLDITVWPREIYIIPGVRTGPDAGHASLIRQALAQDVMRGEETQVWGLQQALALSRPEVLEQPWVLLWPGSHTKLISVSADGRIMGSFTTLAGELFAALKSATLLHRSLPEKMPADYPAEILAEAAQTVREQGFMRAAFWTRVADISGVLNPEQRAAWLSAAVIAEDAAALSRHPWLNTDEPATLFIGGESLRRGLYQQMMAPLVRCTVTALSSDECDKAAALGAVCLYRLRGRDGNAHR